MTTSSMFDDLKKAGASLDLSTAAAQVEDAELMAGPVQLLVYGLTREVIEGGPSNKPMEVWVCFGKGRKGLVPRTIRGRSQLARDFRYHAADRELSYVTVKGDAAGEVVGSPGEVGGWMFCAKGGEHAFLAVEVSIDSKKGRMAGQGRGFVYNVKAAGMLAVQAQAAYPELKALAIGDAVAALPFDAADADASVLEETRETQTVSAGDVGDAGKVLDTTASPKKAQSGKGKK